MGTVGLLIFFAVVGAAICAKARVAGGAIVFALLGLVLFIGTPAGAGLPDLVADFLSTVGAASEPLTEGSGAVG
ncbi:hypothetical protein [Pseudonocardia sp.]|uniref:hypothetical protein n=1 Tax=Pseudonocardia sp. TaxID=60912 RepID=UPI00260983FD|nr:hypothetical protein [Pseudonocardia sp.]